MAVWCAPVLGLLEQESRNCWRAQCMFFIYREIYNSPILPERLGGFCWRIPGNDRTRRLSYERSRAVGGFI